MIKASAHGVSKRFGATLALDGVHLTVQSGEVHGLVGHSGAGKSTLVSILTGLAGPDAGRVRFEGEPAPPLTDRGSWRRLVACVHQRSMIIPELTVAENLYLNRQSSRPFINWKALYRRASAMLETFGVGVRPDLPAGELSVEQRQLVEIARALASGARFVILDEPTARLDGGAIDRLFASVQALRQGGLSFLYVAHRPQEVYDVCQTVTVLRDGRGVLTQAVARLTQNELAEALTGRTRLALPAAPAPVETAEPEPPKRSRKKKAEPSTESPPVVPQREIVLAVAGLRLRDRYDDLHLDVGLGEIVGLTGSSSSGKVALAETIAGMRRPDAGSVIVEGVPLGRDGGPARAVRIGIGFVPGDVRLIPLMSLAENATLPVAARLGRYGIISRSLLKQAGRQVMTDFGLQAKSPGQPVSRLSGGDARKVALARALATQPKALVLIDPTAGADTRATESLHDSMMVAASRGTAILLVSGELDDLRICDRVLVMHRGRIALERPRGWNDGDVIAAIEGAA